MNHGGHGKPLVWSGQRLHKSNREWSLNNGPPVSKIAFGFDHCAYLCEDNSIFMEGDNSSGQLGLGHENKVSAPTQLLYPQGQIQNTLIDLLLNIVLNTKLSLQRTSLMLLVELVTQ